MLQISKTLTRSALVALAMVSVNSHGESLKQTSDPPPTTHRHFMHVGTPCFQIVAGISSHPESLGEDLLDLGPPCCCFQAFWAQQQDEMHEAVNTKKKGKENKIFLKEMTLERVNDIMMGDGFDSLN